VRRRLGRHLRHSAVAAGLSRWPALMDAAVRAATGDQRIFDDVVELGLADGRLTARTLTGAVRRLAARPRVPSHVETGNLPNRR
jgi:hypothetical protein